MRELIKNGAYSFTNNTRQITVTDERSFTAEDIRLIINETKKIVIASSMQKDNLISVINGVITYSDTIATLATGDKLTIEIDFGAVPTETLVNEMNVDRSIICQAVRDKGQQVNDTDNSVLVASKIRAISSSIRVASTSGIPEDWHSLNEAVASVNDVTYPYKYALLIPKGVDRVYLQGANRFDMSDGFSTTNSGSYTFDKTKDKLPATKAFYEGQMAWMVDVVRIESNTTGMSGNVNLVVHVGETLLEAITLHNSISDNNKKISLISGNGNVLPTAGDSTVAITGGYQGNLGYSTRWIVFSSSSPNPVHAFGTAIGDPAFSWARKIIWLFIYNISIQGLNMDGCYINKISFDESYRLTNGIDDSANNTFKFIQQPYQFRTNHIQNFRIPAMSEILTDIDRKLDLNSSNAFVSTTINQLIFPKGVLDLVISGLQIFYVLPALTNIIFPNGLINLTLSGVSAFSGSTGLIEVKFPAGLQNLTITGNNMFYSSPSLTSMIFPDGLLNLNLSGAAMFYGCSSLSYLYIPKPVETFTGLGNNMFASATTQPLKIELGENWNYSINFGSTNQPNLQAAEIKEFILARLALYDMWTEAPTNAARLSTNGTTTVTGTDGMDFTKYFRAGMSIQIERAATGTFETKVIQSLTANELILTTAASDTAVGRRCKQSGITLTFGATNLAKISGSAELIAAQAAGYTFA